MKKVFKLNEENKNQDRLLESIKHEIRKYIKREKRKPLPEDVDFWDLKCKFAKNDETPEVINFNEITNCINAASSEKCDSFYMEIISEEGIRVKDVIKKDEFEEDLEIDSLNDSEDEER